VNSYNNKFYIALADSGSDSFVTANPAVGNIVQPLLITIPVGFYNPQQLVTVVNDTIAGAFKTAGYADFSAPQLSYGTNGAGTAGWPCYTMTPGVEPLSAGSALVGKPDIFIVSWCKGHVAFAPSSSIGTWVHEEPVNNFGARANFFNLIGFPQAISGVAIGVVPTTAGHTPIFGTYPQYIQGDITETLYSPFYDITCPELHAYAKQRDGTSSNGSASNGVLCRLFIADDISVANYIGVAGYSAIGQSPSVIHRQFTDPKQIEYSPNTFIGGLTIQVLDAWGQLVPLPVAVSNWNSGAYPDFQITCACSEE